MIIASIYVTGGAILVGVPIALFTSVFMARYCPKKIYRPLKSGIELMAGVDVYKRQIWKFQFKVQLVISKADYYSCDQRIDTDSPTHFFTWFVIKFHAVGNQSFHNGDAGGKCSKSHHQKESNCYRLSQNTH